MNTEMNDFNKKRKYAKEEVYQEEHLEGDGSEVAQNLEKLEETIKLVVDRLEGFEKILQGITKRFKKKRDNVEVTNTFEEFDLQENEGDTVTLAFPLQTIEEVSQFESDDLDSIVETFIKNLFSEHKNFSIVFKCLFKDELTVMLSDWDKMSRYRFFSEILYDAMKDSFAEYDDFILEMRKQIMKAFHRVKSNSKDYYDDDFY